MYILIYIFSRKQTRKNKKNKALYIYIINYNHIKLKDLKVDSSLIISTSVSVSGQHSQSRRDQDGANQHTLRCHQMWQAGRSARFIEVSIAKSATSKSRVFSRPPCLMAPESISHKIPLNHHFPMVFLWFKSIITHPRCLKDQASVMCCCR